MTEEKQLSELTKEELIQKCEELQKGERSMLKKQLDLLHFFSSVMTSAHNYLENPIYEKDREDPPYYTVTPNKVFIEKYGLYL